MTIAHVYNKHNAYKTTISLKKGHKLQNCSQSNNTVQCKRLIKIIGSLVLTSGEWIGTVSRHILQNCQSRRTVLRVLFTRPSFTESSRKPVHNIFGKKFSTHSSFWNVVQGSNHIFKVGGPIPWSRVLLPFYRKIRQVYPVWCSRLHNHTVFIKKLCKKVGVHPNFGEVRTPSGCAHESSSSYPRRSELDLEG